VRFGPVALAEAEGAILAHSVGLASGKLRKGMTLDGEAIARLGAEGHESVIVARLEPGDLHENDAAEALPRALVPDPAAVGLRLTAPFTGRVNVIAEGPGLVRLDVAAVEAFNRVNPMITVATVPPFQQMGAGGMVATIKVISYAVPEADVMRAARAGAGAIGFARPTLADVGLVVTRIPGGPKDDKAIAAIAGRVEALGGALVETRTVAHERDALSGALGEVAGEAVLILTGSATSDPQDVAPAALRAAGGRVERFGMPVDPGNLLFLGDLDGRPVIGLPGCARSPALNGADWVLGRVLCGLPVRAEDIAGMGVGGLLKEIPTRPQPRAGRTAR